MPGLEALLAAAIDRESLLRATVETEALRRSDEIKTALLRTVSHDLRTPITAIRAAAEALTSPTIDEADRAELREAIIDDSDRLAGAGRQPARPLAAAHGDRGAVHGLDLDRGGRRGRDRRPRHRSGPLPALDRRQPPVHPRRRRPARAGLRQPALQRRQVLGRRAGLGARPRGVRPGGDPGGGPRARASRSASWSASSRPSTGARTAPRIPARASAWRSSRASSRRTAAASRSSRCPGRGRPSWSSFPLGERHRPTKPAEPAAPGAAAR